MPIIDHSARPLARRDDKISVRSLVDGERGARALSISEMVVDTGFEGRLHTHEAEQAITVLEGSIQFIVGDEVQTVRAGYTLFAPAGTPHKLVNNTWVPARMYVACPTDHLDTRYLE